MNKVLRILFGEFSYNPPLWLSRFFIFISQTAFGKFFKKYFQLRKSAPKKFYIRTGSVILITSALITGGYLGYDWWQSRPKPRQVTFQVIPPNVTNAITGVADALSIRFSDSVARLDDLNKAITDRIKLKPDIAGAWSWANDQTLKFVPDEKVKADWQIGTKYKIEFEKNLFADHIVIEKLVDEFTTQPLTLSLQHQEFYIDPKDPRLKRGQFKIRFSHAVQSDDFESHLHLSISSESVLGISKNLAYTIQFNKYFNEAFISSDPIDVTARPQVIRVLIDQGYKPKSPGKPANVKTEFSLNIPSRFSAFWISDIDMQVIRNEKYEPEQIIMVKTSLDAKSEDVAKNLKMWLLPKDKPADQFGPETKKFKWSSPSQISGGILAIAKEIPLTLIPSEHDNSKVHSFKISTNPEMYAFVEINKGLRSLGDFELANEYKSIVRIGPYPEEISVMSEGSILTLSGELKVPLQARNARTVEIKLNRIIPEQVNHLLSQMFNDIKGLELDYDFLNTTAESFTTKISLSYESAKATQFFSYDLQNYLNKSGTSKGIFLLTATVVRQDDTRGPTDKRLIMVTDLGLVVKETQSGTNEVFSQNFNTGLPVANAQVEVIGKNGLTVLNFNTDQSGHAVIPNLKDFNYEKQPIAFSIRTGSDQAFLPYRNNRQNLQYSHFDVGGLYERASSDHLNAMLFSDRGIYRPGEKINIGIIINSQNAKLKNQQLPLQWSVTDPHGNTLIKEKVLVSSDDLKSITFKTDSSSPTGNYDVSLHLIKSNNFHEFIGQEKVRVEEFQPDRLKIRTSLSKEKAAGWVKNQDLTGLVNLRNMFGVAAEDRVIKARMALIPQQPVFKGYADYQFTKFDNSQIENQRDELEEKRTNDKGVAEFELKLSSYLASYYALRFEVEGFEAEGGRSVHASSSVMLSSLDYMVGAKPDGDLSYIYNGAKRLVDLIAIDSDLKKTAVKDLKLEIVERKYVSVLTQSEYGQYKYQSVLKMKTVKSIPFQITAAGTKYSLETEQPGDYFLIVKNKDNLEVLNLPYTVIGKGNLTRSLDRNAELQLVLNKKDYSNGEDIELQIKAPYKGSGLITIEREGVYQYKWFKTDSSATVQKIKIPEGLTGNAYVVVTLLRAIDSKEVFMSPLSYAVAPFSISLDDHKTQINLSAPERVKPGQKLEIRYSTNKPTDIILYGVDEGILQVAEYKMPDPLSYFFRKRALQVKTYQMLDLLMPEFSLLQNSQSPGGDEGMRAIGKNLNPFKSKRLAPVAFWSGVIKADARTKTYTYEIPDYFNGNIRVMAVAANAQNFGSSKTDAFVRGDFIITPSSPVFVAPLDEFRVGLTVSNQKEKSGEKAKVKLTVKPDKFFEIAEGGDQNLEIPEGHETATFAKLKAINDVGAGKISFEVSHEKTKVISATDISIRPAVPYQNYLKADFTNDKSIQFNQPMILFKDYAKNLLSVSRSPLSVGYGLQAFLDGTPYGCTEQMISRAFPSILVHLHRPKENQAVAHEMIRQMVRNLRSRQTSDGGFSLYEAGRQMAHAAATLHSIHFLIEVQDRNLFDVSDLIEKAKPFLAQIQLQHSGASMHQYRKWAQALYLSARLKIVNGASLTALRNQLQLRFKNDWLKDPVAYYLAATYKLYKKDDEAEALFKQFSLNDVPVYIDYQADYFDGLSSNAVLLYMSALYAGNAYKKIADPEILKKLLNLISENRYQTYSAANLILAFDAMESRRADLPMKAELKIKSVKGWETLDSKNFNTHLIWQIPSEIQEASLITKETEPIFYSYQKSGFAVNVEQPEDKKFVEIVRQYRDEDNQQVQKAKVGDEIKVTLALRTTDQKTHPNMAIVDLLPGGFELVVQKNQNDSQKHDRQNDESDNYEGEDNSNNSEDGREREEEHDGGAFIKLALPKAYAQAISTNLVPLQADYIDQREDRIVIYATLTPEIRSFEYKIKAVSAGKFRVPAAFAESMYNREIRYVGPTGWVEVSSEK